MFKKNCNCRSKLMFGFLLITIICFFSSNLIHGVLINCLLILYQPFFQLFVHTVKSFAVSFFLVFLFCCIYASSLQYIHILLLFPVIQHHVCTVCERPFQGHPFYERGGRAYCERHFDMVRELRISLALNAAPCLNSLCVERITQLLYYTT